MRGGESKTAFVNVVSKKGGRGGVAFAVAGRRNPLGRKRVLL